MVQIIVIDWKQFVIVNGSSSSRETLTSCVCQGSILGSLLFIIYVNDLPRACPNLDKILFTDDITVTATKLDENQIEVELNAHSLWLASDKLVVNVDKTNYLKYKTSASNSSSVRINDSILNDNMCCIYI